MRASVFPEYTKNLEQLAEANPRIHTFTSAFFHPEEFQIYLNAADIAVLPFVDVLTSGSAILALSFGKPLILPAIGCMPELIDDTQGILFQAKESDSLAKAFSNIRKYNLAETEQAAFARAHELNWENIAQQIATLYQT